MFGKTLAQLAEWHRWFAWFPVMLPDGRTAWLCWVERRVLGTGFPARGLEIDYRLPRRSLGHWLPKDRR